MVLRSMVFLMVTVVVLLGLGAAPLMKAPNIVMGLNPYDTNQKIADEKEAAQIKQWNMDAERKANGTMPICKEGQHPLSDWMDSLNESTAISGDIPINYETCVEPEEEIKGAIILFK